MKANEDKHIEELIDKMMKSQITLDSPSLDFTSKVMQHIEIKKQSDAFVYKPLLSKQTILAISSLSLVTLIFYFFQNNTASSKWRIPMNFSTFFKFNLNLSETTNYCLLIGSIMLITQVVFLKKYYHNNHIN